MSTQILFRFIFALTISLPLVNQAFAQTGPGGIGSTDGSSNLVLWLKADQGVTTSGSSVTNWADQSGYGNDASQGSGSLQPLFQASAINGQPAIQFDGSNDELTIPDDNSLDASTGLTMFIVFNADVIDGSPDGLISKRNSSSSQEAYSLFLYQNNYMYLDIDDSDERFNNGSAYSAGTTYITGVTFDGSLGSNQSKIFTNGSQDVANTESESSIGNYSSDITIASLNVGYGNHVDGYIAEIIIYDRTLDDVEKYQVEDYLANKYGVTLGNDLYAYETNYGNDIDGISSGVPKGESNGLVIEEENFDSDDILFWGHDGDAFSITDPGAGNLPAGNNGVLDRVWRADVTGGGNSVTLKFDVSSIKADLGAGESFRALVMSSYTGNDYSGALQYKGIISGDTLTVTGVELTSDDFISLGKVTAEANANYYSYQNGDWQTASTWTQDPGGTTQIPVGGKVPSDASSVTIRDGITVTITGADTAKVQNSVTIEGGSTLDLTTNAASHNFGSVSGSGLLRLSSSNLPSAGYSSFTSTDGGTIEYYDVTTTLPSSRTTYNDLVISNSTASDYTVTLGSDLTINGNLSIEKNGSGSTTFTVGDNTTVRNLTIEGNVTTEAGTVFDVNNPGSSTVHEIDFRGDITNEGTIDFHNSNGHANATFTGTSNNSFISNGTTTLYSLILDKGTDQTYVLSVSSDSDNLTINKSSGNRVELKNGTLKLMANLDLVDEFNNGANYDVSTDQTTTAGLWIDGATVDMTGSNALVVYGKFRLSSGSIDIGRQGMVNREDGEIVIEGGTMNVAKYRVSSISATYRGSFTISGGTMNIDESLGNSDANFAAFSMPYADQSFTMTGGAINVTYAETSGLSANGGIQIAATSYTVTGGTFVITIPNSSTDFGIASSVPFYNLTIQREGTSGSGQAIIRDLDFKNGTVSANDLVVLNNFELDNANSNNPTFDANGYDVSIKNDFTLDAGATYQNSGATNTTTFNQTSTQTIALNGTIDFDNLRIETGTKATLTGSSSPLTVNNDFAIVNGELDDGGFTINVAGDVTNSGGHSGAGKIVLNGSASAQTISGNGSGYFENLELNNTNGAAGSTQISLSDNITVNNTLTLANDRVFDISSSRLTLGTTATISSGAGSFSNNRMIITSGNLSDEGIQKNYTSSGGSFTYPLGTGTIYTPASISIADTDGADGSITVRAVSSEHPNVSASNQSLTYYWKVSSSGFGASPTVTHSYTYNQSDAVGTESNYVYGRFDQSDFSWSSGSPSDVNTTSNIIGSTSTNLENVSFISGDFTAGEPSSFAAISVFYSSASGNWNSSSTWNNTGVGDAGGAGIPGPGDPVVIGDGGHDHTITVQSANSATAANIKLSSGSTLDLTSSTGNDLGEILEGDGDSGFGTIRLSSATLPAGNFSNIVASGGGTFEFYRNTSDFTLPAGQSTYNNLMLTTAGGGSGTLTLPASDLSINGNLVIGDASNSASLSVNTDATAARSITVSGDVIITGVNGSNTTTFTFTNGFNQSLDIVGDISVTQHANLDVENAGSNTHTITLEGDLTNDGTFDLTTGSGGNTAITFTGSTDATVSGSGTSFDLFDISIDKGSTQSTTLEINATNLTISGAVNLQNGTFKLTDSSTLGLASSGTFTIPSTVQLWVNGSTAQLTGTANVDLKGKIRVSSGTLHVGTTNNDNYIKYTTSGTPTIQVDGGALNVTSQIRRPTSVTTGDLVYIQSGGTVKVGTQQAPTGSRGVLEITNNSSFTMSGGTLAIIGGQSSPSIASLLLKPATSNVTGGTVQIGDDTYTTAGETITINATAPVYHFVVNANNNPTAKLSITGLTIKGNATIESGATFNANSLDIDLAGDFTNNGSYTSGLNTTTFNGASVSQTITGDTDFYNLVINNSHTSGGVAVDNGSAYSFVVDNNLSISNGTFELNQSTLSVKGDIDNQTSIATTNNGVLKFTGTTTQELSGSGSFEDLTINNAAGILVSSDFSITGTLTLTDGVFNIGGYTLTMEENADFSGSFDANAMVQTNGSKNDGGVTKYFSDGATTTSPFEIPLGTVSGYTPATYDITSNSGSNNYINVKPVATTTNFATDGNSDGDDLLSYYWSVSSSGFSGLEVTHTYEYLDSDVQTTGGTTESNYESAHYSTGNWNSGTTDVGSINSTTNIITIDGGSAASNNGVSYFDGIFTAGANEEFGTITIYYSRVSSGNWDDSNSWSTTGHGGGAAGSYPDGNPVEIDASHTISTNGNSRISSSLVLNGTLTINSTTGHDFGNVSGSGVIELTTNVFPGGDYSNFNGASGGTFEFGAGSFNLPSQTSYNNLILTTSGTKVMPSATVTVNGDLTISAGNLDASVNNGEIKVNGDWINNSGGSAFISGSGTVSFTGSSTQQISGSNTTTFYNLNINTNSSNVDLTQDITITNDLTLQNGFLRSGTQTITVQGDITNTGSSNAFNGQTGTVELTSASTQSIGGTASITFNNLTVNNSSSSGITLDTDISVSSSFLITDGDIVTGTGQTVTLGSSASISGETSDHYVIGNLSTTRTVGSGSSNFGGIGFDIAAGPDNLGDVTVKRVSGSDGIITVDSKPGIARRWVVSVTGANPFATPRQITYEWVAADDNFKDLSNMRVYKRPSEGSGEFSGVDDYKDISTGSDTRSITVNQYGFSEVTVSDDENPLPVDLKFIRADLENDYVVVRWMVATERENFGFHVQRRYLQKEKNPDLILWNDIGFVEGRGTTQESKLYSFVDRDASEAGNYEYRLRQEDYDGEFKQFGPVVVNLSAPEKLKLNPNYPNPFNPTTTISWYVPEQSHVRLEVFDVTGRRVAILVNESMPAGRFTKTFNASNYASGLYFLRLVSNGTQYVQKMYLLK